MGLPGSGKTTLAKALAPKLKAVHWNADAVRANINSHLGFSEEHRKKIGEANRKRIISEETKNKLRGENNPMFGKTGDKNPSFGKKHSIETKKKISENRKNSKVNLTDELRSAYSNACKGKIWYNDGKKSKRFYENQQPSNYTKGRV